MESQLLVRLEEMLEADYDLPLDAEKLASDMRTLAYGVLLVLRREESEVLGYRHAFDSSFRCMRCGKSRAEVEMAGSMRICTGGV